MWDLVPLQYRNAARHSEGVISMSGLLGQILGSVLGGAQSGQSSPVAGILQQVLATRDSQGNSGVAAIVSKFESAGLGTQVQSWVGTGANTPVSPDHINQVFSPQQIEGWAAQAGTTPAALSNVLAQALPHVVDHLTPGGQVPSHNADVSEMLNKLLGGQGPAQQT
jgi:uncharacterized protein YidB (DUF937 family)